MTINVTFDSRLLIWALLLKKLKISPSLVGLETWRPGPARGQGHRHSQGPSSAGGKYTRGVCWERRPQGNRVGYEVRILRAWWWWLPVPRVHRLSKQDEPAGEGLASGATRNGNSGRKTRTPTPLASAHQARRHDIFFYSVRAPPLYLM